MKITLIAEDNELDNGSYSITHIEDECDKCLKNIGKKNLLPVKFYYLDKNDKTHKDMSPSMRINVEPGYRHYRVCSFCFIKEERRTKRSILLVR